jgi:hypothetical protein
MRPLKPCALRCRVSAAVRHRFLPQRQFA